MWRTQEEVKVSYRLGPGVPIKYQALLLSLGGGWEEGKGEEWVEKSGEEKIILEKVANTTTADYWVPIKINK